MKSLKVFAGTASRELGNKVARTLGTSLSKVNISKFSDGETRVNIEENVRGYDCFIIQSTCNPTDSNLMELLILLDALKRSSPGRITAVIPYYGYARQDKQDKARAPIAARLVADLIATAGADRIMAMDLHASQIQGFFNIPVDNLYAKPVLLDAVRDRFDPDTVTIVSPDVGGASRARGYAKAMSAPLAIIDKRREQANQCEVMNVVGDVEGRNCIIVDDMVDTAGTLVNGAKAILNRGAKEVVALMTHPVLSGKAFSNLAECSMQLVVTDTIPLSGSFRDIKIVSVAPILAEAIRRTHNEESISSLFN